jgi:hypothetical protein
MAALDLHWLGDQPVRRHLDTGARFGSVPIAERAR